MGKPLREQLIDAFAKESLRQRSITVQIQVVADFYGAYQSGMTASVVIEGLEAELDDVGDRSMECARRAITAMLNEINQKIIEKEMEDEDGDEDEEGGAINLLPEDS